MVSAHCQKTDVSVIIPEKKITVLIGANGSGKSTLLKALVRLLSPRSGYIYINGRNISEIGTKNLAQQLSMLPQSATAPGDLTVFDLLKQGRYPYHNLVSRWTKADEEITLQAIEKMGLADIKDTRLSDLSGGQRQRAWIALALAQNTDFFFLDEPTNHLNLKYQIEILGLLILSIKLEFVNYTCYIGTI
ncbi:MAG: ABC transporter ATP-binding protein [Anaerocolumna sp.]